MMMLPCFATAVNKEKREIAAAMLKLILLMSAGDWHIGVCRQDLR